MEESEISFSPGDTVTVPRGDGTACRPYLYVERRDPATHVLDAGYGLLLSDTVRPWTPEDQVAWVHELERLARVAELHAQSLRDLADIAKLSERNAGIEAAGRELRRVEWRARDIGYGVEEGVTLGYWADGHDWIGKRELIPADGSESLYLFDDEVVSDERG